MPPRDPERGDLLLPQPNQQRRIRRSSSCTTANAPVPQRTSRTASCCGRPGPPRVPPAGRRRRHAPRGGAARTVRASRPRRPGCAARTPLGSRPPGQPSGAEILARAGWRWSPGASVARPGDRSGPRPRGCRGAQRPSWRTCGPVVGPARASAKDQAQHLQRHIAIMSDHRHRWSAIQARLLAPHRP